MQTSILISCSKFSEFTGNLSEQMFMIPDCNGYLLKIKKVILSCRHMVCAQNTNGLTYKYDFFSITSVRHVIIQKQVA
jgi:hypothetical protein